VLWFSLFGILVMGRLAPATITRADNTARLRPDDRNR